MLTNEFSLNANKHAGIILFMDLANEKRRYILKSSLVGWVH